MTDPLSKAACQGKDPDLWFPERHQGSAGADKAKAICQGCPVRQKCLDWAIDNEEAYGIWGGLTPAERRRMT